MTKLSDTQALILSAAAQRPERIALPLPDSLRGGAAAKVVGAMLAKGLLQEVDADLRKGEPMWRKTGDGHGVTLVATDAGLAAIGIEVSASAALPQTDGFRNPLWSAFVVVGYVSSIWLLTLVVRDIPVSIAYAVWAGLGTAGIAVVGMIWLGEPLDVVKAAGIGLIVAGVVVLNVQGAH